ncbi:hypothetical protein D3C76_979140 [compost metagenome]
MVIPLPDLRDLGVKAADMFIHQVVTVIATKIVEAFGDLALRLAGDVAPHPAALGGELRRYGAVGVDGVAAVDKEVRQAQAHGFVDAHAADVRVDTVALAGGVAAPDEANIAAGLGHAAQVAEPGFAGDAALGVFELHAIENRLVGGQPGEFDPRREVAAGVCQRRDQSPGVGKEAAGVPLHHHACRAVAAAPDDRFIAQQVAGLHAIGELRTILDRGDHRRSQAWHQQAGTDGLHDTPATEVKFAHGVLPEKRKTKSPQILVGAGLLAKAALQPHQC